MIHFIEKQNRRSSALAPEIERLGPDLRVLGETLSFKFRSRLGMLLLGYPRLVWFSLRMAVRSLLRSRPAPDTVVVWSDIEVIVFALVKALLLRRCAIVYCTFIFTPRDSALLNLGRRLYFGFVLALCRQVICHSRLEIETYAAIFPRAAGKFVFVPWGGLIWGWDQPTFGAPALAADRPLRVLAAGRSGRDYPTLVAALAGLDVDLTIICDHRESLNGVTEGPRIRILRDCYDDAYMAELRRSDVVAVPLTVGDVSAGQMVIIQAKGLARPVVATRTPTVEDYVTDGEDGLLVRLGSAEEMRRAILRLRDEPGLYERLQRGAHASYVDRHGLAASVRNLVQVARTAQPVAPSPISAA
ncbi:glycosyltransferase family 4 protein [Falsiroseomonas oryzae]|uniref:glycosyltransferase family 4 protein n=1 Tax=Falsiroseomonas oryzae TaxID=2766473 RepID=UPI0022EA6FD6|nr:glycosyltransferase family 4 protein [Roseomonas sp. MO-31]